MISTTDTLNVFVRETAPGSYEVAAHDASAPAVTVSFTPDEAFTQDLLKLEARGEFRVLKSIPDQDPVSSRIGETLFRTFIKGRAPTPVSDAFDRFFGEHDPDCPQRIALHLPRSLYWLPWEVLRDPADQTGWFLSLQHSVIRVDNQASGQHDPRYTRFPPTAATLQLLLVVSNPSDMPIGDFEPDNTGDVNFHKVAPATYSNFQTFTAKASIKPDGFVFLGHGDISEKDDAGRTERLGVLIFVKFQGFFGRFKTSVSDRRFGFTVGTDLGQRERLRLGCLLACESAWAKHEIPFLNTVVGSILERSRIPFVLGAQTKLGVYAAQGFLTGMVESLNEREPLDIAITKGRRYVHALDSLPEAALDWWVPVLYSRTTSFDMVAEAPGIEIPAVTRTF